MEGMIVICCRGSVLMCIFLAIFSGFFFLRVKM